MAPAVVSALRASRRWFAARLSFPLPPRFRGGHGNQLSSRGRQRAGAGCAPFGGSQGAQRHGSLVSGVRHFDRRRRLPRGLLDDLPRALIRITRLLGLAYSGRHRPIVTQSTHAALHNASDRACKLDHYREFEVVWDGTFAW
jgi:hypothetical protein